MGGEVIGTPEFSEAFARARTGLENPAVLGLRVGLPQQRRGHQISVG